MGDHVVDAGGGELLEVALTAESSSSHMATGESSNSERIALFTLAQRFFGPHVLGDVPYDPADDQRNAPFISL